ncbi:MAG TPA: tail fiber domain-containing protein [Dongiaceae bacterium]|nr:tail fiber domain-containing protein [Dongiaceae bacterium]
MSSLPLALLVCGLAAAPHVLQAQNNQAQPPGNIAYQGFLTDANGVPLATNAPANFTVSFRIYNASTGGTPLWGELQVVTVDRGFFTAVLGQGIGLPNSNTPYSRDLTSLFNASDAQNRYLGLEVAGLGSGEIAPRLQILSSPYALSAANALTAQNATFAQSAGSATGAAYATNFVGILSAANLPPSLAPWSVSGVNVYRLAGNVGIGLAIPVFPLDVAGSVHAEGANHPEFRLDETTSGAICELGMASGGGQYSSSANAGDTVLRTTGGNLLLQTGAGNCAIAIDQNNRVGIGTFTPGAPLDVAGQMQVLANGTIESPGSKSSFNGMIECSFQSNDRYGIGELPGGVTALYTSASWGPSAIQLGQMTGASSFSPQMTITHNGWVGVGTSTPLVPLDVVATTFLSGLPGPFYRYWSDSSGKESALADYVGIRARDAVLAAGFIAVSDARIKEVQGRSDGAADLRTLRDIRITDYTYKDKIAHGGRAQKKVIGQQVETVFPQAVSRRTDVVPDLFKKAELKEGWIELATDLKAGERVRLIGDQASAIYEVQEVRPGAFRTAFPGGNQRVFVYGREVQDFRVVDYDAIAMLNVSATQELARRAEAAERELAALRSEVKELRADRDRVAKHLADLEPTLARLESRLNARDARLEQASLAR